MPVLASWNLAAMLRKQVAHQLAAAILGEMPIAVMGSTSLQPVGLARNLGFSLKELRRIQKLVTQHQAELLEAWHGHLGADG